MGVGLPYNPNYKIEGLRMLQIAHWSVAILDGLPDLSPIYITIIPPSVNIIAAIRLISEERIGSLLVK
jgi:hypothetical protein